MSAEELMRSKVIHVFRTIVKRKIRSHATDNFHKGAVIGGFNGELSAMYAFRQFLEIVLHLLYSMMARREVPMAQLYCLLHSFFVMTSGAILMCFLRNRKSNSKGKYELSGADAGLQEAFVWVEFTKQVDELICRKVEELIRRKLAKAAAGKEFLEFIKLLAFAKSMPSQDKPCKSSWLNQERAWSTIESLEAYAIDACKSDEQRRTAGTILKEMGLAKTASSTVNFLAGIAYFPVHVNLDLLKLGIPTDHSEEIISAAPSILLDSVDPYGINRKNLTDLKVYAIDVDEADELDDALSAAKLQDGRIEIWIHVADPTRYVQLGSIVNKEAMRRGTSVFLPTATYSMFPENLATGAVSLRQGELCNAITVSVVLHNDGSIVECSVFNSVIEPTYMLSYGSTTMGVSGVFTDFSLDDKAVFLASGSDRMLGLGLIGKLEKNC